MLEYASFEASNQTFQVAIVDVEIKRIHYNKTSILITDTHSTTPIDPRDTIVHIYGLWEIPTYQMTLN